eukprot:SAG11_NODE_44_length_20765_cov_5.183635_17_plen_244_part_00
MLSFSCRTQPPPYRSSIGANECDTNDGRATAHRLPKSCARWLHQTRPTCKCVERHLFPASRREYVRSTTGKPRSPRRTSWRCCIGAGVGTGTGRGTTVRVDGCDLEACRAAHDWSELAAQWVHMRCAALVGSIDTEGAARSPRAVVQVRPASPETSVFVSHTQPPYGICFRVADGVQCLCPRGTEGDRSETELELAGSFDEQAHFCELQPQIHATRSQSIRSLHVREKRVGTLQTVSIRCAGA